MGEQPAKDIDMEEQPAKDEELEQPQPAAVGRNAGNVWQWKSTDLTISLDGLSLTVPSIHKEKSPFVAAPLGTSARAERIRIDWHLAFPVYFEIQIIKKADKHKKLFLGYCLRHKFKKEQIVGQNDGSIGVADMKLFRFNGKEFATGKKGRFSEGDVIGCGLQMVEDGEKQFFFTLNGEYIVGKELPENFLRDGLRIYPMVTICNEGESINTNFGAFDWRWTPAARSRGVE